MNATIAKVLALVCMSLGVTFLGLGFVLYLFFGVRLVLLMMLGFGLWIVGGVLAAVLIAFI
jgi:hypothetical protein